MDNDKVEEIRTKGCNLLNINRGRDEKDNYQRAVSKDFETENEIVILIHGFTSHGEYMGVELAPYLISEGYQVFLFNYDSYLGILHAVNNFRELLESYDRQTNGKLSCKKIFIIGHSMGGLVARRFTIEEANRFVRGVVMLATPNNGVMENKLEDKDFQKLFNFLIKSSEALMYTFFAQGRTVKFGSKAVKELCKIDNDNIIFQLNNSWFEKINDLPPTLSISGGKNYLEFPNKLLEKLTEKSINNEIQKLICFPEKFRKNDGIVIEDSVNMTCYIDNLPKSKYTHIGENYNEYLNTNHNNIHLKQIVSTRITEWLKEISKG